LRNRLGGDKAQQLLIIKSSLKSLKMGPETEIDDDNSECDLSSNEVEDKNV